MLIPLYQPYVSTEVGPGWPPLTPGDSGKVGIFVSIPLICAHLSRARPAPPVDFRQLLDYFAIVQAFQ